ncbi:MFS transporter [bacterium]|nr:MFS transporter [bacterium]
MDSSGKAISVLTMNTLAFVVCFACWMLNGVLVTFLIEQQVFHWSDSQIGWLIGIPVLTGATLRLPVGVLTDKYGGRIIFAVVMLLSAIPMYLLSMATEYSHFMLCSLGFGLAGTSFAVGVAYTSVWFPKERQGTVLGIFGAGNAGAAITSIFAPRLLRFLTDGGEQIEGWRNLPKIYAGGLVAITVLFWMFTYSRKADTSQVKGLAERLSPLKHIRVWRFGLYYSLMFGGFVALSQWLIPYYVSAYGMTIATAGLMASIFSLPSGVIRALGGVLSDVWGPRRVMYLVLSSCAVCCALLIVPRMDIMSPGKGVMAKRAGTVTAIHAGEIIVDNIVHPFKTSEGQTLSDEDKNSSMLILPKARMWQKPTVNVGDQVTKGQLLAKGETHIYFQANVWVFTFLLFVVGFMMGIGNAAVFRHIPDYFPREVGVVGGIVGALGALGGFFWPIFFGYMLAWTGLWTMCWVFFTILSIVCLWWMHKVIQRMLREAAPALRVNIENAEPR